MPKPNNYVSKSLKIFRGTCLQVELAVNKWLSDSDVIIRWITQSEADTNTISLTIFYTETSGVKDQDETP